MQNKSKLLIVDLDDTLIGTSLFKNLLFKRISKITNLREKKVKEIYKEAKKENYKKLINSFVNKISQESNKSKVILEKEIYSQVKNIKINKKVFNFVKKFKGDKILLTLGNRKLQSAKIDFLEEKEKISRHFKKIIILDKDKVEFINSLIKDSSFQIENKKYQHLIILDDKSDLFLNLSKYLWIKVINPKRVS